MVEMSTKKLSPKIKTTKLTEVKDKYAKSQQYVPRPAIIRKEYIQCAVCGKLLDVGKNAMQVFDQNGRILKWAFLHYKCLEKKTPIFQWWRSKKQLEKIRDLDEGNHDDDCRDDEGYPSDYEEASDSGDGYEADGVWYDL